MTACTQQRTIRDDDRLGSPTASRPHGTLRTHQLDSGKSSPAARRRGTGRFPARNSSWSKRFPMTVEQFAFVVDDDPAVRESVTELVTAMGVKVRSYGSAEEFLAAYDHNQSGCLVLAIRLRGVSGLDLLTRLREEGIRIPAIVLTAFADVPLVVQAMQAGALTVLQKPHREQELWDAIRQALSIDTETRQREVRLTEVRSQMATLTHDERRVLELVLAGKTNKGITQELSLRLRTVEARRHSLMVKLKADSLAELIRLVTETRMLLGLPTVDASALGGTNGFTSTRIRHEAVTQERQPWSRPLPS